MPRMPAVGRATRLESGTFTTRPQLAKGRESRQELVILGASSQEEADARDLIVKQAVWNVRRSRVPSQAGAFAKLLAEATSGEEVRDILGVVRDLCGGAIVVAKPHAAELPPGERITFEEYALEWTRGELATRHPRHIKRKRSAYTDEGNLRRYVFPVVGDKPIAFVTLDDYERVLNEAPARAKKKRPLTSATVRQIAQVMRRVLAIASYPGKLIPSNPIPQSALPSVERRQGQFAWPHEDAILMRRTRVDLGLRFFIGVQHRLGWRRADALGGKVDDVDDAQADEDRLGDVPALTWGRVNLARKIVMPDRNKTGDTRITPLEDDLVRALTAWKALQASAGPDDPVFVFANGAPISPRAASNGYTRELRAALVEAGEDRPELWKAARGFKKLCLHDARASMVTVALRNDRSEDWVRRRTKHKSGALERYKRELSSWREVDLGDWVPLDQAIPELRAVRLELPPADAPECGGAEQRSPAKTLVVSPRFEIRCSESYQGFESLALR